LIELLKTVPLGHYRIAFIESTNLIIIAKTFRRIRGPLFREKVRIAVAGPAHPLDEKKSGSKARDFLFELSVAAYFRSRGLPLAINPAWRVRMYLQSQWKIGSRQKTGVRTAPERFPKISLLTIPADDVRTKEARGPTEQKIGFLDGGNLRADFRESTRELLEE
jgi:hypothetical protein